MELKGTPNWKMSPLPKPSVNKAEQQRKLLPTPKGKEKNPKLKTVPTPCLFFLGLY